MFNSDQNAHMEYLSTLKPEEKCKCGWYPKGDCYNCNLEKARMLGVDSEDYWNGTVYILPDGRRVKYFELCKWLRSE